MNLSLTHDQLTLETIATILNSAYIKTEVVKRREGAEDEHQIIESYLADLKFEVFPGRHDDIIFRAYMPFANACDEERLRKSADYMDNFSVDTTYIAKMDDGGHLMCFHHNHVIPEDETISPAYLVKLARYFVRAVDQHLDNWAAIEGVACGTI